MEWPCTSAGRIYSYPSIQCSDESFGPTISIALEAHTFGISRKKNTTDIMILGESFSPFSYKIAAFANLAHWLTSILAEANSIHIIIKLVERKSIKIAFNGTTSLPRDGTTKDRLRWIRVPHLEKFSWGLNNILKQDGFKLAYYNLNPMKINLCKGLKDAVPVMKDLECMLLNVLNVPLFTWLKLGDNSTLDFLSTSAITLWLCLRSLNHPTN